MLWSLYHCLPVHILVNTCLRHTATHFVFTREGQGEYEVSFERFENGRKKRKIKRVREQVDAATRKWRRIKQDHCDQEPNTKGVDEGGARRARRGSAVVPGS